MLLNKKIPFYYIFNKVKVELIFVLLIGLLVYFITNKYRSLLPVMPLTIPAFIGTAISILLSFQLNQSYERWWEARRLWGSIVNNSRSLVLQLQTLIDKGNETIIKKIAYRQIAWCYALGQTLRGQNPTENVENYLSADELNVMNALKRAYELIRSNFWKYVLITLSVYFGTNILISMVTFPLMIPMFFFMMRSMETGLDFNTMIRMQAVFGVVILPLMALIQGFSLTYMKSAMMLTYLRLTRPVPSTSFLPGTVEATA